MQIPSKNPMLCGDKQDNTYMKINLIFHKTVTFFTKIVTLASWVWNFRAIFNEYFLKLHLHQLFFANSSATITRRQIIAV